jgi:hypothetical protein
MWPSGHTHPKQIPRKKWLQSLGDQVKCFIGVARCRSLQTFSLHNYCTPIAWKNPKIDLSTEGFAPSRNCSRYSDILKNRSRLESWYFFQASKPPTTYGLMLDFPLVRSFCSSLLLTSTASFSTKNGLLDLYSKPVRSESCWVLRLFLNNIKRGTTYFFFCVEYKNRTSYNREYSPSVSWIGCCALASWDLSLVWWVESWFESQLVLCSRACSAGDPRQAREC